MYGLPYYLRYSLFCSHISILYEIEQSVVLFKFNSSHICNEKLGIPKNIGIPLSSPL